jgi:hypothetical protein
LLTGSNVRASCSAIFFALEGRLSVDPQVLTCPVIDRGELITVPFRIANGDGFTNVKITESAFLRGHSGVPGYTTAASDSTMKTAS